MIFLVWSLLGCVLAEPVTNASVYSMTQDGPCDLADCWNCKTESDCTGPLTHGQCMWDDSSNVCWTPHVQIDQPHIETSNTSLLEDSVDVGPCSPSTCLDCETETICDATAGCEWMSISKGSCQTPHDRLSFVDRSTAHLGGACGAGSCENCVDESSCESVGLCEWVTTAAGQCETPRSRGKCDSEHDNENCTEQARPGSSVYLLQTNLAMLSAAAKVQTNMQPRGGQGSKRQDCKGELSKACILSIRESFSLFVPWLLVLLLTTWALQGFPYFWSTADGFRSLVIHLLGSQASSNRHVAAALDTDVFAKLDDGRRPSSSTIPELVEEQSKRWPEVPFLQSWTPAGVTQTMTFSEFAIQVYVAGVALQSEGVGVGMHLGILSQGCEAYQVFLLGCMKLGAVPVLLSWRQPVAQLVCMARVASCSALLTSKHYATEADALQKALALSCKLLVLEGMQHCEGLKVPMPSLQPADRAVVLFTSGSTSTPKAVPHDHSSLLWNCSNILTAKASAFPAPLTSTVEGGTVCFLPNFHAIGLTVNFLFNLYAGARCSVLQDPYSTPVTPQLLLQACAALTPSVLSTVPWMIEAFCNMLCKGDPSTACLRALHHIAFAGAQLPPTCAAVLRDHNIRAAVDFGQTELGGPLLMGRIGGDLQCMCAVPGVGYSLRSPHSHPDSMLQGHQAKGELVLYGAQSVTRGYLAGSEGRPLCPKGGDTRREYWTGDIFEEIPMPDGKIWLRHCSRDDDLLVHTSGEMTNPLPMEHMLTEHPLVHAACVLGDGFSRPVLVLELEAAACQMKPADLAEAIWLKVQASNELQPRWSEVLPQHVVCLWRGKDERMPVSVKGNVQRQLLHKRMEATMRFLLSDGPQVDEGSIKAATWLQEHLHVQSSATASSNFDSLSMSSKHAERISAEQGYFYLYCIVGVVIMHYNKMICDYIKPTPLLQQAFYNTAGVIACTALQGFSMYAGFKDLQSPPTWHSIFQLVILIAGGQAMQVISNRGPFRTERSPETLILWYFGTLIWMRMIFLSTQQITLPSMRCAIRVLIGVTLNFASTCQGSWPFFYRLSIDGKRPFQGLAILPGSWDLWLKNHLRNEGSHLFIFYFAFPYALNYLLPIFSARFSRRAACMLLSLSLAFYQLHHFQGEQDTSWKMYDASQSWFAQAGHDAIQHVIQFALLTCIITALPRRQSFLSDAGGNSLMVYFLNVHFRQILLPLCVLVNAITVHAARRMPEIVAAVSTYVSMMFVYVFMVCFLGITSFSSLVRFDNYTATVIFLVVAFAQYYFCSWALLLFPEFSNT